jgi:hypothetical protein
MNKSTHNILNSKYTNIREHKNSSLKTWGHPHKISTTIHIQHNLLYASTKKHQ